MWLEQHKLVWIEKIKAKNEKGAEWVEWSGFLLAKSYSDKAQWLPLKDHNQTENKSKSVELLAQFRLWLQQELGRPKQKAPFSTGLMSLAFVKWFRLDGHHCSPFQPSALSEQVSSMEHGGPNYEKQQIPTGKGWDERQKERKQCLNW